MNALSSIGFMFPKIFVRHHRYLLGRVWYSRSINLHLSTLRGQIPDSTRLGHFNDECTTWMLVELQKLFSRYHYQV